MFTPAFTDPAGHTHCGVFAFSGPAVELRPRALSEGGDVGHAVVQIDAQTVRDSVDEVEVAGNKTRSTDFGVGPAVFPQDLGVVLSK